MNDSITTKENEIHAYWKHANYTMDFVWLCTNCGESNYGGRPPHCPHCNATMGAKEGSGYGPGYMNRAITWI